MVTMKGRRGWSGKSSGESLIAMGWLPTGQTLFSLFFSLFSRGGGQSVQGPMLIYHVLLSSPGGLYLPSSLGADVWWSGSPPGFSV
jgi:hypothetical protein